MTSKEALEEIKELKIVRLHEKSMPEMMAPIDEYFKEQTSIIEKDLEVLEILKKHVSIFDTDPQRQYPKLIILSGSEIYFEEAKIINRWLKNGKD